MGPTAHAPRPRPTPTSRSPSSRNEPAIPERHACWRPRRSAKTPIMNGRASCSNSSTAARPAFALMPSLRDLDELAGAFVLGDQVARGHLAVRAHGEVVLVIALEID